MTPVIDVIEEQIERIVAELRNSAESVADKDPYLAWKSEREEKIDSILSELWNR